MPHQMEFVLSGICLVITILVIFSWGESMDNVSFAYAAAVAGTAGIACKGPNLNLHGAILGLEFHW